MPPKKKKIRADFRKNRSSRARQTDWTRRFESAPAAGEGGGEEDHAADEALSTPRDERISGKGDLSRKRTILASEHPDDASAVLLAVDETSCQPGRVLSVHGLTARVEAADGSSVVCVTRRLLRTLSTDQRHVVAAGDRVLFRPAGAGEGIIERIEPRHGTLSRTSRRRQHLLVTNVDQVLIVGSAAQPDLKPNLIDRFLVSAHLNHLKPLICINKVDLVDPADLQPLIGVYAQMGYPVLLLSAKTGQGIERLKKRLAGAASVVAGQSGVGKSSLLNAADPSLDLRVRAVNADTQKGKHTTTTARLIPLQGGGYVVDTPGIRQFELWDIIPAEIGACYRDLRPYITHCRFPNCSHTHETDCAVKNAVADGRIDARRYESYCILFEADAA